VIRKDGQESDRAIERAVTPAGRSGGLQQTGPALQSPPAPRAGAPDPVTVLDPPVETDEVEAAAVVGLVGRDLPSPHLPARRKGPVRQEPVASTPAADVAPARRGLRLLLPSNRVE
jgi:hypothetical protein